jgi:hypothetical protein
MTATTKAVANSKKENFGTAQMKKHHQTKTLTSYKRNLMTQKD